MAKLPRTVVSLGVVSLLTDASSEMIYPLLPLFVVGLGGGPQTLGLIEGIAESTSSLLKLVAGKVSDRSGRRKPLVLLGYGLSSAARPLMGLAAVPLHVLGIRFADRVGKGLRTSPRDAIIGQVADPAARGRAFGFHRAMDHLGAVIGPLLAALAFFLLGADESDTGAMRTVFLLAAIPALAAVVTLAIAVPDVRVPPTARLKPERSRLSRRLRLYLAAVFVLNLALSTDAFLLLRATDLGVAAAAVPLLWSAHHVVKVLAGTPGGALSDRIGRLPAMNLGYAVYVLVYAGFAFAGAAWHAWGLMLLYGVYFGLTEGTEKALVNDLAAAGELGGAFGAYHLMAGLAALPASLIFGVLWDRGGPQLAFLTGAAVAAVGVVLLNLVLRRSRPATDD